MPQRRGRTLDSHRIGGRMAKLLDRLTLAERQVVRQTIGTGRNHRPGFGEGWSLLFVPSTGDPHIVRLIHRDGAGVPTVVVQIRERRPAPVERGMYVRPARAGSIELHPEFE